MIDHNTLRINFVLFYFVCLPVEDSSHAQLVALALTASSASLILAGLFEADSDPLGAGRSPRVETLAKNC